MTSSAGITSRRRRAQVFLALELEGDRYVLPAAEVVQVVPRAKMLKVSNTPSYVVGILNYHGRLMPVFDLVDLTCDRAARARLSTRVVLVRDQARDRLMGFLAERVTDIVRRDAGEFAPPGVRLGSAGHLGDVALGEGSMVRRILVDRIVERRLLDQLFDLCIAQEDKARRADSETPGAASDASSPDAAGGGSRADG